MTLGDAIATLESASFLIRRVAELLDDGHIRMPPDIDNLVASAMASDAVASLLTVLAEIARRKPEIFARPQAVGVKDWFDAYDPDLMVGYRRASPDESAQLAAKVSSALRADASELLRAGKESYGSTFAMFNSPDAPIRQRTTLYRWYDAEGRLLYVGITNDLEARFASHSKKSSWASFAERPITHLYRDRAAAMRAERRAIEAEQPLFNHQHNDTPEARARLVAYLIEKNRLDLLAPAVSRG